MIRYVVSPVPSNMINGAKRGEKIYYCHASHTPGIPVFGSIGSKAEANRICKIYNESIGRRKGVKRK